MIRIDIVKMVGIHPVRTTFIVSFLVASSGNNTIAYPVQSADVLRWFNNDASASYRTFINTVACPINQTSSTYRFCVHDTILSQSSLLGQLTVRSSTEFQATTRVLRKGWPHPLSLTSPSPLTRYESTTSHLSFANHCQSAVYLSLQKTLQRHATEYDRLRDCHGRSHIRCVGADPSNQR